MRTNLNNVAPEILAQELVNESEDINRLNLFKANQRNAFLMAIERRPKLLEAIKGTNAEHFLTVAINANYQYFTYLKREQYSNNLAQLFLGKRLEDQDVSEKGQSLIVQKSLDNKLIFNYSYSTIEGDELYYMDKELGVPASLKSGIRVSVKLLDAVMLIEKLDTHVTQLGANKICSTLTSIIASSYKAILNNYISENEVGFYTLCASRSALENEIKVKLGNLLREYGIAVNSLTIQKLAIPKDIQNKLEDQAFEIRKKRADMEANAEFAEMSLKSYAQKLALEEKFPNAQHSLTEYEKDMALHRYLIKTGREKEQKLDHSIKLSQKGEQKDEAISQTEDIVPEVPQKKNVFKIAYIVALIICVITSLACMFAGVAVGLIMLGVTIIIFGAVAAFNYPKFRKEHVEGIEGEDYNE